MHAADVAMDEGYVLGVRSRVADLVRCLSVGARCAADTKGDLAVRFLEDVDGVAA